MEQMNDKVLGTLTYRYGWVRDYDVVSFGTLTKAELVFPCGKGSAIEDAQRQAFIAFDGRKDAFMKSAEEALFIYYQENCHDYRARFGSEFSDKLAPRISEIAQLDPLVKLTQIVSQRSFGSGERVIGILYSCSWDSQLGVAVKMVNEEIDEVGPQDIVI